MYYLPLGLFAIMIVTCRYLLVTAVLICMMAVAQSLWSYTKTKDTISSNRMHVTMMGKGFAAGPAFKYSGSIRPGKVAPPGTVPPEIGKPDYALDGKPKGRGKALNWDIEVKSAEDIQRMRIAGRIAREVLDIAISSVRVGMTTEELDKIVHRETVARNSYPSPLNYHGFPKSVCTSINEIICHGIPSDVTLKDGDIINIDVTIFHDGFHGDCSETVLIGNVATEVKDLVKTTYDAWKAAINFCKPGEKYSDIGGVIEDIIAAKGYTTVKEFCGHGLGRLFHTTPNVLHYKNTQRNGIMMPGHTFTIEPMICLGVSQPLHWPDKWTVATADGKPTAQFEHTLLITETGVEELTGKLPNSPKYFWEI